MNINNINIKQILGRIIEGYFSIRYITSLKNTSFNRLNSKKSKTFQGEKLSKEENKFSKIHKEENKFSKIHKEKNKFSKIHKEKN